MTATNGVDTTERDLRMIIDTITRLACRPARTGAPNIIDGPVRHELTRESRVTDGTTADAATDRSLSNASTARFACLLRHWTWADEALARFEHELTDDGWGDDDDPLADHPFGAYYHWCALLCGFAEAALEHGLLPERQMDALRPDLEASLPGLKACRQLLVEIPASLEEHPRIVDLLRDGHTRARLRRLHDAFGEALRQEQTSRELALLLYEH